MKLKCALFVIHEVYIKYKLLKILILNDIVTIFHLTQLSCMYQARGGNNMNIKEKKKDEKISCSSTFLVKVIFTRNASMQGYVQWKEKEKTLPFRSCMELLHLMEGSLELANQEGNSKVKLRSWDYLSLFRKCVL